MLLGDRDGELGALLMLSRAAWTRAAVGRLSHREAMEGWGVRGSLGSSWGYWGEASGVSCRFPCDEKSTNLKTFDGGK